MKNVLKGISIGFCVIGLLTAAAYLFLSWYYMGEFSYNTWINGIYCTGKSVAEVNRELSRGFTYDDLTVLDLQGESHAIVVEKIDYTFDFTDSLETYKSQQNPYLWIDNLFQETEYKQIRPRINYDKDALEREVNALPFMREAAVRQTGVIKIQKTSAGYELVNGREQVLDRDMVQSVVSAAIDNMEPVADLRTAGCYADMPLDNQMKGTLALWNKVRDFQDCGIVYQFGEERIPLDASVVSNWFTLAEDGGFVLDEQGKPVLDEEKVKQFVAGLAETYDTLGGTREFMATRGDTVTVTGGTYGNQIDQEAETAYLIQAFQDRITETRTPEYIQKALYQGKDDIGDTYIEIDMTSQTMYYYVKGRCVIETPVVTGNTSLRRGTPEGVNYVYAKQRNRILRGEDYASPVDYWLPVKGAVGIHDASWRSKYGGEIYKNDGSHGCINTPYDAVEQLYEMVEIGTPCVMFY